MSNAAVSLFRAVPLLTIAGLLAGCPAVEPVEPEPTSPSPRSGVWGLHIADIDATGLCAELAPAVEGRVVRLDVDADERGELVATLLGVDLFGGHNDGFVWADAELPLPMWGGGWDEPVVVFDDEPDHDGDDVDVREDDRDESVEGRGDEPAAPPCEVGVEIEEECGTPEPMPEPWPELDAGIYVSLSSELRHAEAMSGVLSVTVSNGWAACSFDASIDASYLGEEAELDDGDDVWILPVDEPMPGEPVPGAAETAPAED